MRPEVLDPSKVPGDASAAAAHVGTMIWVAGPQGPLFPLLKDCLQTPNQVRPFCNSGFWPDARQPMTYLSLLSLFLNKKIKITKQLMGHLMGTRPELVFSHSGSLLILTVHL